MRAGLELVDVEGSRLVTVLYSDPDPTDEKWKKSDEDDDKKK